MAKNPFAPLIGGFVRDNTHRIVSTSISDVIAQIAARTSGEAAASMAEFSRAYPVILRRRRNDFVSANTISVVKAQKAIVSAYQAATADSPTSYRMGQDRLSGGILLDALNSPNMYEVGSDYVFFINEEYLDRQAAHWYRLNFGAGTNESSTVSAPVRWFGQESGLSFGWANRKPSKSFILPAGLFTSTKQFYPGNSSQAAGRDGSFIWTRGKPARTIKGRHFLEPGIYTLADELPRGMETIIIQITDEAIQAGGKYWGGRRFGRKKVIKTSILKQITGR